MILLVSDAVFHVEEPLRITQKPDLRMVLKEGTHESQVLS